MNICIITSSFPNRHDETPQAPFLIDFMEFLIKRGHRVFAFTQNRPRKTESLLENVHVFRFPWMGSQKALVRLNPLNPLDLIRIINLFLNGRKALIPYLKENKIDACMGCWVIPGGYFANFAFARTGIPYAVWALGSDIYKYGEKPFLHSVMKKIIRDARCVFADGFDMAKRIETRYGKSCSFLATTRKLAHPVSQIEDRRKSAYHFLFVGRLEKVKGIDVLLRSAALLAGEGSCDFHLTIAGGGSMEDWVRNFLRDEKLERCVTLAGSIDNQALAALYASSDCVVISSRSESIPLVFSEALQFEKELIVTDVGDMGTLGREYEVASVVPAESPSGLKEAMKKKGQKIDKANERKRRQLAELFDMETSVDRFLQEFT